MRKNKLFIALIALSLIGIGTIDSKAQNPQGNRNLQQQINAEKQRMEKENYDRACQKGTLDAYNEYLKMYPQGRYVSDINNRITDHALWNKAKSANTIDAYNNYIRNSKFNFYNAQANEAILELRSISEWQTVKNSDNIRDVESFMQVFPESSLVSVAEKRIHELRAVAAYKAGDYIEAYNEFNKIGGRNSIDAANREFYDKSVEYNEYQALSSNSSQLTLLSFMTKYPMSQYYDSVSNMMALAKARNLNLNSKEDSFNEALSYARDKQTRETVQGYIDQSKKSYSDFQKQQRRTRIRSDGGIINWGFEIADVGAYPGEDDSDVVWYYNVGLGMKVGNYRSPAQFEIGAKPGIMFYTLQYGDETESVFHLPLYAKLKINLMDVGYNSKLYVNATGYYNAVKEDFLESDFAIAGGLGLAWRHFDWSVYYKNDIGSKYEQKKYGFIGTSLGIYF